LQDHYATDEASNDVTVLEMASGATKTIAVGNAPQKVVSSQWRYARKAKMRNHKHSIDNLRRLFITVMSASSNGLFAFIVLTQLAQQRFAAPHADLDRSTPSANPIAQRAATAPC
jgi:hypothetical protein